MTQKQWHSGIQWQKHYKKELHTYSTATVPQHTKHRRNAPKKPSSYIQYPLNKTLSKSKALKGKHIAKTYSLIYNKFQTSLCNCLCNAFTVTSIASGPEATNTIVNETACETSASRLQWFINLHFHTIHHLKQLNLQNVANKVCVSKCIH